MAPLRARPFSSAARSREGFDEWFRVWTSPFDWAI